jgi:hypothetical protein
VKPALAAAILCAALAGRARAEDTPDPRELFAAGQYDAAGAAFEARWQKDGRPSDGLNAVTSWRAAGRYARARVLLAEVQPKVAGDAALVPRAALLADRLDELTGTLTLPGLEAGTSVRVDGEPAQRQGDQIVLDVGERDLVFEREGCNPLKKRVRVLPRARLSERVTLKCPHLDGNLHVHLRGGGDLYVDDDTQHIGWNVDLSLRPGPHHVEVRRQGVLLYDHDVTIEPRATRAVSVQPVARASIISAPIGVVGVVAASTGGDRIAATGVRIGIEGAILRWYLELGTSDSAGAQGRSGFFGMDVAMRFWKNGPTWQLRRGGWHVALDVDPWAVRMVLAAKGSVYTDDNVSSLYLLFTGATLQVEHVATGAVLHLSVWPVGFSQYTFHGLDADRYDYAGAVSLSLAWSPMRF